MIGTLLTFLAMAIVSIVVLWIVFTVVGAILGLAVGVASFLLFKVAPIMLIGWIVLKVFDRMRSGRALSTADRKWLEGE